MKWQSQFSQVERVLTAKGRRKTGLYSIEGVRLVERAHRAGLALEAVLIAEAVANAPSARLADLLTALRCEQVIVPDDVLVRVTNGRSLGGIIGLLPLPKPHSLAELLAGTERPLILTAVNVIDPGNCGAMIRTAHASGCDLFVSVGQTDPFHPKAVRTSMGSIFKLPTVHYETPERLMTDLAKQGVLAVGTAVEGKRPLTNIQFPDQGIALFMGNEYHGLPPEIATQLDLVVAIPMANGVDSYSVNAATAIFLYEINRQKFT